MLWRNTSLRALCRQQRNTARTPAGWGLWLGIAMTAISISALTCTAARGRHSTPVFIKRTQTPHNPLFLPPSYPPTAALACNCSNFKAFLETVLLRKQARNWAPSVQINRPRRPQQQQQFHCLVRLGAAALTSSEGPHQDNGPQAVRKAHHETKQSGT